MIVAFSALLRPNRVGVWVKRGGGAIQTFASLVRIGIWISVKPKHSSWCITCKSRKK